MYEEIAGVPLIVSGPSFPRGRAVDTPVSHVDVFPTVLETVNELVGWEGIGYPGVSLTALANGASPERTVLSEYHGMGSTTGAYMIRMGKYKLVHYVKYPPQLFDLEQDPEEIHDLSARPDMESTLQACRRKLFAMLDPVEVDERAKSRQSVLLDANGGRQAVVARGDLGFTPVPGMSASFQ